MIKRVVWRVIISIIGIAAIIGLMLTIYEDAKQKEHDEFKNKTEIIKSKLLEAYDENS